MHNSNRKILVLILGGALLFNSGCGEKEESNESELTTYGVSGTVFHSDGTPLSMGIIEFQPLKDAKANGFGEIKDGKFTLTMMLDKKKYTGVPAGKYRVTVIPRGTTEEQQGNPEYIVLQNPITIKAQPENELKLTLPKKK